jgi:hypothetical protein
MSPEAKEERRQTLRVKIKLALYGLTIAQYDALLASQNYRCAICRSD